VSFWIVLVGSPGSGGSDLLCISHVTERPRQRSNRPRRLIVGLSAELPLFPGRNGSFAEQVHQRDDFRIKRFVVRARCIEAGEFILCPFEQRLGFVVGQFVADIGLS